jgi:hypothetical protein
MLLRCLLLAVLIAPVQAGGLLLLSVGRPAASNDPAARGAMAIVRIALCHANGFGRLDELRISAEGLIDGRRVTQPVKLTRLSSGELGAIHWTQPERGAWVLRFLYANAEAYVEVGPGGIKPQSHQMRANRTPMVLKTVAAR